MNSTMAMRARVPQMPDVDIHELLKREAFDGPPSYANHFERGRPAPGGIVGCSDQYIILDSFNKLATSDPTQGLFSWDFMVQGVTGDQVIGVRDKVDTVVAMQFGQFQMPALPAIPYSLASPGPGITLTFNNINESRTDALSYGIKAAEAAMNLATPWASSWAYDPMSQTPNGVFTIQVKEAGLQSISDRSGARHHLDYALSIVAATDVVTNQGFTNGFATACGLTLSATSGNSSGNSAATAVIAPTAMLASPQGMPGSAWDTYIFTDPLKDVHGITLQFRSPDTPLSFQPDCYYSQPFQTDISGNLCMIVGPANLNNGDLCVGDRMIVRGFSSGNTFLDNYMNNPNGLVMAAVPNTPKHSDPATYYFRLGSALIPDPTVVSVLIGSVSGSVVAYFDPNINITGAILTHQVPNPTPQPPPPVRDPKSLAPWTPPVSTWTPYITVPYTVSGAMPITNSATVYISKLRLRIPVRLRRVVQRLTNYMSI